jgi:pimeloyl-ACP methyl ester carboxylesterase
MLLGRLQWRLTAIGLTTIGPAADFYYNYLESKVGYRLKMREFFKNPPEDRYINIATAKERTTKEARNPIIATNAGDLFHRSFEEDLKRLHQPTLIIAGSADKVVKDKRPGFGLAPYSTKMSDEKTVIVDGKVMLPWESPDEVMKELRTFLGVPSDENDAVVKNVFTTADNLL